MFAAEVAAMAVGIETVQEIMQESDYETPYTCYICTDSQAAAKAIDNPRRQSGQSIIKQFLDCADNVTNSHPNLQIRVLWVPGHESIDGNEHADEEAKQAAINTVPSKSFKHRPLKSALVQSIKKAARCQ